MKLYSPAALRNSQPLLSVLRQHLPQHGKVLEIASGSGQHAAFFTKQLPDLMWQASDASGEALTSIEAYRRESQLPNFLAPLPLRTIDERWSLPSRYDAIVCCNMLHIASWEASVGLFRHAHQHLVAGGLVLLYGPFLQAGVTTAASNLSFNQSLQERNPAWGLRHVEDEVLPLAKETSFALQSIHQMPANNLTLVFEHKPRERPQHPQK